MCVCVCVCVCVLLPVGYDTNRWRRSRRWEGPWEGVILSLCIKETPSVDWTAVFGVMKAFSFVFNRGFLCVKDKISKTSESLCYKIH